MYDDRRAMKSYQQYSTFHSETQKQNTLSSVRTRSHIDFI
jgi:hypothetical protein